MSTTYPRIPAPAKDYDFTNESQFRTILDRFLRQIGQQAVLQDAGVGANGGGTAGSLVKWVSSSHLGTSTVSETTTLVTVANALRVTGITSLAGNLSVTGIAQLLNALNVTGATTLSSTLGVTGLATFTADVVAAVDGTPAFGQRGASRFGSAYLATRLWLGTAPATTVIAGLDNCSDVNGQAFSLHVPDQGFTGWEYAGSSTNFITTVTDANQVSPGTAVANNNSSGTTLWNRCTNNLQDDNFNYSAVFYDCGFNVNPQEAGIYFLAPNTGTTYQVGEGLTLSWEKHASGNIVYYYRNASGTVVDTSVVGFLSSGSAGRAYIQVQVRGATLSVYTWRGTTGTITPTLLGTVTMSAAAQSALRDGAHQRVGVYMTYSVGGNPWSVNAITFTPTTGESQQADGFASFVNAPLASGSYADGGGLYIGNHGFSGLTQSEGLLIDDQSGSVGTSYALRTKRGPVQLGDATTLLKTLSVGGASTLTGAVTMASTLGVTGAITGSSTIQGTTITATTRFTGPLVGTTSNVDVVFDRNSVTQLTLGSLAATFAGTVQGTQLKSTIATGTPPLTVTSTDEVVHLTANYLGAVNQDAAYFLDPTHLSGFGAAGGYLRSTGSAWARVSGIAASDLTGTTLPSSIVTSSLTTIGTLVAGGVPASLVTAGTFGTGDYTFPGNLNMGAFLLQLGTPNTGVDLGGTTGIKIWDSTRQFNFTDVAFEYDRIGVTGGQWAIGRINGTANSPTAALSGDILGEYVWRGYGGTGTGMVTGPSLRGIATETFQTSPARRGSSLVVRLASNGGGPVANAWTFDQGGDLLAGNATAATGDNTYSIGNASQRVKNLFYGGQLTSSVATGTAPFVIASTTLVANLHAANSDQLGGTVAASYALLASPALTGTPTAPTATANTNTTQLATTAYVDRVSGAASSTPANPTGTTSTTAKMMGCAGSFTPTKSPKACLTITGQVANGTIADGSVVQVRYGTGTAPANGATLTGTQVGASQTYTAKVAAQFDGFCIGGIVSGLTIGTAYWIDVALNSVTGGTSTVTSLTITATEE